MRTARLKAMAMSMMLNNRPRFYQCSVCRWYVEATGDIGELVPWCEHFREAKMNFETKDSGKRQEFSTGMVRDVQTDKPRYDLLDMPMLKRWAELMGRGAVKYGENNWRKAATQEELTRFKASALRHMMQWFEGDTSEDHGAAVMFNIAGAEMVREKLRTQTLGQVQYTDIRQG